MTAVTRGSESAQWIKAWAHVRTPNGASGSSSAGDGTPPTSDPPPSGRITRTPRPNSWASGRISRSTSRSRGLYGICTIPMRPARISLARSPNALDE